MIAKWTERKGLKALCSKDLPHLKHRLSFSHSFALSYFHKQFLSEGVCPSSVVRCVIVSSSNCVVNLTADKKIVLKEAHRVLKVLYH